MRCKDVVDRALSDGLTGTATTKEIAVMNLKKIFPRLFVSEQINPADAGRIAAQGIRTIICNRPHCETPDQPDTETLAAAAADVGIEFLHIPVCAPRHYGR